MITCLRIGIQAGIGLFIAVIGLQKAGVVVDDPATLFTLGELSNGLAPNAATLALLGLAGAAVLMTRKIPGAILIAMTAVAVVGLVTPVGDSGEMLTRAPDALAGLPPDPRPVLLQLDWLYPFRHWTTAWVLVLTLLFVDLFDSIGTLIGVSRQAKLVDGKGELPKMREALFADAAATATGACLGCSPVTAYVESAAGVEAGGRTGLTALVVAACFLLALFFHPLVLAVPAAATAPALILVGFLMMSGFSRMDWSDPRQSVPGAATALLIPLGYGIANGIALGCIGYALIMWLTGAWSRVHWLLAVLSVLFTLKFAFAAG